MAQYEKAFNEDPFSEATIMLAESVTTHVAESRRKTWIDFVESIDMKESSQKAWNKLKKLCGDRISDNTPSNVTANQVATQLIANSRSHGPKTKRSETLKTNNISSFSRPYTNSEVEVAISKK